MRMRHAAVMAGLALGLMVGAAKAAVFDFSYEIPASSSFQLAVFASGFITATATGTPGEFLITGISGIRNGERITGLLPTGAYGGNDNLLNLLSDPHVTDNGFSYTVDGSGDNGFGNVNMYFADGITSRGYTEYNSSVGYTAAFNVVGVSSVPLPSSAPMFGAALLGLASLGYAAKRKKAAAAA